MTNQQRSERAYRAILGRYDSRDFAENIIDLLTDLMHLAPDYGEFEVMLETAKTHFDEEKETSEAVTI